LSFVLLVVDMRVRGAGGDFDDMECGRWGECLGISSGGYDAAAITELQNGAHLSQTMA
jgi:hypothetical protein